MPTSSDPTETAEIGDLEQRHTAQANHLAHIAKMASPFGYSLIDDVALEYLRAEAFAARNMRRAVAHLGELDPADTYEARSMAIEQLIAAAADPHPTPPAAA